MHEKLATHVHTDQQFAVGKPIRSIDFLLEQMQCLFVRLLSSKCFRLMAKGHLEVQSGRQVKQYRLHCRQSSITLSFPRPPIFCKIMTCMCVGAGEGLVDLYGSLQPLVDAATTRRSKLAAAAESDTRTEPIRVVVLGLPNVVCAAGLCGK